jgi:hypothetical protein
MPAEPKKGEMNTDFNFKVDTNFHIVTKMASGRYLDRIGNNIVIKTSNGRNTQNWYFHQQSRTVRNRQDNRSFDIQNAGRSNNMQAWNTNSGWFQLFKFEDEHIINIKNKKAFDVSGGKDVEGQNVIVWKKHNGLNQ